MKTDTQNTVQSHAQSGVQNTAQNTAPYYAYTAAQVADKTRDTILFIHGAAMDHSVWSHQSRYFAYHGRNVLAVDLPGHGRSRAAACARIGEYADWVGEVAAHAVGRAVHLVGHSMGALIALQCAAAWRAAMPLASLSLLGFGYPMAVSRELLDAARDAPSTAYSMMTQWSHASQLGGEPAPGFWSAGMQMSMMSNSRRGVLHADLTACNEYRDGEAALDKIAAADCAILFICGVHDKMAPRKSAQQFAARRKPLPKGSAIVSLDNCGHNLMGESPDGVRAALKRFIDANVVVR